MGNRFAFYGGIQQRAAVFVLQLLGARFIGTFRPSGKIVGNVVAADREDAGGVFDDPFATDNVFSRCRRPRR